MPKTALKKPASNATSAPKQAAQKKPASLEKPEVPQKRPAAAAFKRQACGPQLTPLDAVPETALSIKQMVYADGCEYRDRCFRNFVSVKGGTDSFWVPHGGLQMTLNDDLRKHIDRGRVPIYNLTFIEPAVEDNPAAEGDDRPTLHRAQLVDSMSIPEFRVLASQTSWTPSWNHAAIAF